MADENGQILTLTESTEGIWQSGNYYHVKSTVETSLEQSLRDTSFPYTLSACGGFDGNRGENGGMHDGNRGGFGGTSNSELSSLKQILIFIEEW